MVFVTSAAIAAASSALAVVAGLIKQIGGVKKGDKFKIVELTESELNGKKVFRKKEVGTIKVSKVEDENFSICTVDTGGAAINSKFVEKIKLQVISLE